MSKSNYWELLKDPRWQQMRLRVMEREGFACQDCDDKTTTLNVHHTYYEKGNAPWEYPEDSLHCLCETCHKRAEVERVQMLKTLGRLSRDRRLMAYGFAQGMRCDEDGDKQFRDVTREQWHKRDGRNVILGLVAYYAAPDYMNLCAAAHLLAMVDQGAIVDRQLLLDAVAGAAKQFADATAP